MEPIPTTRSAYSLRTFAVGSVLPMCRNKANSAKVQAGLNMLLSTSGPDPRGLLTLGSEGFALRAVSWKTSACLATHNGIMRLAGDVGDGRVATVDPSLRCLRSARFLGQLRVAMEVEGISDLDRSVLAGTALSLVCRPPPHAALQSAPGPAWREHVVDMLAETRRFDDFRVATISPEDKEMLREKIQNTLLLASIAEAEEGGRDVSDWKVTLRGNKKGWVDVEDRERALGLIETSVVLLVGTRHTVSEKDGLLMDPTSCNVSCSHDVSRRNAVLGGGGGRQGGGTPVQDVPLEMFTLHLGIVVAAAIRLLARHAGADRDEMMLALSVEEPLFEQLPYLTKTKRAPTSAAPGVGSPASKESKDKTELLRLAAELAAFKVQCEARIQSLEGKHQQAKRSKTC